MGQVGRVWVRILGGTVSQSLCVQEFCAESTFNYFGHLKWLYHDVRQDLLMIWCSGICILCPPLSSIVSICPPTLLIQSTLFGTMIWVIFICFAKDLQQNFIWRRFFSCEACQGKDTHRRRLQPRSRVGKLLLCDAKHNWPSPPPASHKDKKRRPLAWQAALFALLGKCFLWRKTHFGLRSVPAFLSHLIKAFLQLLNFSHS